MTDFILTVIVVVVVGAAFYCFTQSQYNQADMWLSFAILCQLVKMDRY